MRAGSVFVFIVTMLFVCGLAVSVDAQKEVLRSDIELTIRHLDGTKETFGKELAEMQIIVGSDSMIKYLHLIVVSGKEKDTHVWYNMANVTSFRYRFLAITGKGKVKLIHQDRFAIKTRDGRAPQISLQDVDDFK